MTSKMKTGILSVFYIHYFIPQFTTNPPMTLIKNHLHLDLYLLTIHPVQNNSIKRFILNVSTGS